jgi:uncharacterized surface protein with fasciclin (FAS1) repeats
MLYKLLNKFLFAALVVCMTTGCKKDNLTLPVDSTTVPRNMGEFIENNYDLSLLRAGLQKAGMLDSLKQPGPWTFFAPDNDAFNAMGIVSEKDFDKMNVDSLRFMLGYHIIPGRYFVSSFPQQMDNKYTTLTGVQIYVSVGEGASGPGVEDQDLFANGIGVKPGSKRNISLANGVLQILRRPFKYRSGTVQDFIAADTSLLLFSAVMKHFGFWDGLRSNNPVTVFAPDNAVFLKYGLTADSIAKMDTSRFNPLTFGVYPLMLKASHVFSSDGNAITGSGVYAPDGIKLGNYSISPNYTFNAYYNQEDALVNINWFNTGGQWDLNNAGPQSVNYRNGLINADELTDNGIVHVIDDLIFNPSLMGK